MYDRSACTPFCTSEDLALHCPSFAASSPPEDPDEAILAASSILAMLSGFTVYGTCTAVVRPTGYICRHGLDAIPLQYPVREILDVMIDGASIDPASYDVIDDEFLVRLVDPGTRRNRGWSYCRQSLDLPATEVGTLQVTYSYGTDIPHWAKAACFELACAIWDELHPAADDACTLPATIRSLSLQGASYAFDEAADEIREAATEGRFKKVARFLGIVNPDGRRFPSEVYSPDMPKLVAFRSEQIDAPATSDLVTLETLYTGDFFEYLITIDAVGVTDICDRTYRMQLRRSKGQTNPDATCDVSLADCLDNQVLFTIEEAVTATLLPGRYFFDVEETIDGHARTIVSGVVPVQRDVTR